MDLEIAQLTQSLTNVLSPALPHLLDVSKKVAEDAGKKLNAAALKRAGALWERLASAVRGRPAAAEAAQQVAAAPEEPAARAALARHLKEILTDDEDLARGLLRLLESGAAAPHAEVHGDGVAVSGDVHGNIVVGGRFPSGG